MSAPTVASAFTQALRAAGVQRVYGLPGEDHLRLLDALPGAGLTYVAARDETAAVIMAATEARATGVPGVALVTIAPGLTNAINGIAHAHLDRVPLLVVTGQHHPERAPLIVRQLLDNHRLVDGLVKWSATASPRIYQILARALETALAPPAGPVLLELRDDVASAPPVDRAEEWPLLQAADRTLHVVGGVLDGHVPPEVARIIAGARRPALLVGGECPTDGATRQALGRAASRLGAPVLTSPSALGTIGPDHPWFAGTFMNGNLEAALLGRSDLLVTLGLTAVDFFNAPWRATAPILAINVHPDTQRYAPTWFQLVGNTAASLEAVAAARAGDGSEWTAADIGQYRTSLNTIFHLERDALTIPAALRLARCALPPDTLVAVDAGFGKPIAAYLWTTDEPNAYFTAHGLSTMGYALPAANALQLAFPERPVVAFMGDGSLLMRAVELGVAAELGIAPMYVAWLDGALAQIETKQLRQHLRPVGARLPRVSAARLADAFGARGIDVHSLDALDAALRQARPSQAPTLIGVHVDQTWRAEWYELMRG